MISLEEEIVSSILHGLNKDELTTQDIQKFFESSDSEFQRLIAIKQLALKQIEDKYENISLQPVHSLSPIQRILADQVNSLEIAKLQFEDSKQRKRKEILKELQVAVIRKKHTTIFQCLFDLEALSNQVSDFKVQELQSQVKKYSEMAEEEGGVYLKYYIEQEVQENLLVEALLIKEEIKLLQNLLN